MRTEAYEQELEQRAQELLPAYKDAVAELHAALAAAERANARVHALWEQANGRLPAAAAPWLRETPASEGKLKYWRRQVRVAGPLD